MNQENPLSHTEKPADLKIRAGIEGWIVMDGTIGGHKIHLGKFEYRRQEKADYQGTIDGRTLQAKDAEAIWQKYQGSAENLLVKKPDPEAERLASEIL